MFAHYIGIDDVTVRSELATWVSNNIGSANEILQTFIDWTSEENMFHYYTFISTPHNVVDELAVFLLAYMYDIHVGIGSKRGLWTTALRGRVEDCQILMQYRGPNTFTELRVPPARPKRGYRVTHREIMPIIIRRKDVDPAEQQRFQDIFNARSPKPTVSVRDTISLQMCSKKILEKAKKYKHKLNLRKRKAEEGSGAAEPTLMMGIST